MNIDLIVVGKSQPETVLTLVEDYFRRTNRYVKFTITTIPELRNVKSMPLTEQRKAEAVAIMKQISASDHLILLDEKGAHPSSVEFATWMQKKMNSGIKRLVFVIGGPYGFSDDLRTRANGMISLSKMTFSHQIARIIFCEQLYRAFTILAGEPYHNE